MFPRYYHCIFYWLSLLNGEEMRDPYSYCVNFGGRHQVSSRFDNVIYLVIAQSKLVKIVDSSHSATHLHAC
jgi:hypothetical protein